MALEEDRLASLGKHTGTSKMLLPEFNHLINQNIFLREVNMTLIWTSAQ